MELALIIYWMIFYSALVGWYVRTAPIIRKTTKVEFNRYMIPRILLPHVMWCYFLIVIFYFFSLLYENKWILVFLVLANLAAVEYFWIRLGRIRGMLANSLIVKMTLIGFGVVILFYFSSASSTYLAQLTKVPQGVFGPFENLLTFILSTAAWIFLTQLCLTVFSMVYMVKLFINKDDYVENLLFVFVSGLGSSFLLVLATKVIFSNAIPYVVENYFVPTMYHDNVALDNNVICTNRAPEEKIILLPSGDASIATLDSKNEWEFTVDVCER